MRIQSQNLNFGAIKIKGLKTGSEASKEAYKFAREEKLHLEIGKNNAGKTHKYIQTDQNSTTEKMVIKTLKTALSAHKGISIKHYSNEQASQNIKRFNNYSMTNRDIFVG